MIGRFFQGMFDIFTTIGSAFKSIAGEFKSGSEDRKNIFANAFSKKNALKWLYFIPVVLMALVGVIFAFFI